MNVGAFLGGARCWKVLGGADHRALLATILKGPTPRDEVLALGKPARRTSRTVRELELAGMLNAERIDGVPCLYVERDYLVWDLLFRAESIIFALLEEMAQSHARALDDLGTRGGRYQVYQPVGPGDLPKPATPLPGLPKGNEGPFVTMGRNAVLRVDAPRVLRRRGTPQPGRFLELPDGDSWASSRELPYVLDALNDRILAMRSSGAAESPTQKPPTAAQVRALRRFNVLRAAQQQPPLSPEQVAALELPTIRWCEDPGFPASTFDSEANALVLTATREIAELADRYLVVEPELIGAIGAHFKARQALWTVEAILLHEHHLGLLPHGATAPGLDMRAAQRLDRSRRLDLRRELHQELEHYGLGKLEAVDPL